MMLFKTRNAHGKRRGWLQATVAVSVAFGFGLSASAANDQQVPKRGA